MAEDTEGVVAVADTLSDLMYAVAGWVLVGLGLLAGISGVSTLVTGEGFGAVVLGFAFVFLVFGVMLNPGMRRRIDRRHGVTDFGRVRSVDRRVLGPDEECLERCVACDDRVDRGLVRRFREEYAVAGIPVYTASVGYNHYCLECASEEVLGIDADGSPDRFEGRGESTVVEADRTERELEEERGR